MFNGVIMMENRIVHFIDKQSWILHLVTYGWKQYSYIIGISKQKHLN